MSHDPAREYASPYSYVGGDPVNSTDPNGECELICLMVIGFAIGFAASSIQAGVNGASFGQAMQAGAIGGAMGAASAPVGAYILQPAVSAMISTPLVTAGMSQATAQTVADAVLLSGSLGQAGYGISQGDYTGAISLGLNYGAAVQVGGEGNAASGAAAGQGAADAAGAAGTSSFWRYAWSEVKLAGNILARDVQGFFTGVVVGTPGVIVNGIKNAGESLFQGDLLGFVGSLALTPLAVAFPRYGNYGGLRWGRDQFGTDGIPAPVNKVDFQNWKHDIFFRHGDWASGVWNGPGLPPGPFGNLYRMLGTSPFALAGRLQSSQGATP